MRIPVTMFRAVAMIAALALGSPAPAQREDSFVAGGDRLAYQSFGTGPCAIVLAGGPGTDPAYMAPVARHVAALGYRAILLAQRGTGRSAQAGGERLTVAGSIADLEDLRRALGAERMVLIGHSFGTAIAQAYADAWPEHVDRLVLLDSVGTALGHPATPLDGWRRHLTAGELATYDALRAKGDRASASRIKMLGSFDDRAKAVAFLRANDIAPAAPALAARLDEDFQRHFDLSGRPPATRFPVRVIAGADDWIRGYEPSLVAHYPAMRLRTVPGAGHFPWVENPAATWRALRWAMARR
jgi:pimeloyl-ACP methyl ester carboxylesterase